LILKFVKNGLKVSILKAPKKINVMGPAPTVTSLDRDEMKGYEKLPQKSEKSPFSIRFEFSSFAKNGSLVTSFATHWKNRFFSFSVLRRKLTRQNHTHTRRRRREAADSRCNWKIQRRVVYFFAEREIVDYLFYLFFYLFIYN